MQKDKEIALADDRQLVALMKEDSRAAFMQLYDRYSGVLLAYAMRITHADDEAEDLVQDVFVSLWDKRHTLRLQGGFATYLYTAVRYRFFDLVDKRRVRSDYLGKLAHFMGDDQLQADHRVLERELVALVEVAVASLPDTMRRIFELSRKEHRTNKEIAELLRLSEKTVKNNLSLAVKILRKKLGPYAFLLAFWM